LYLHGHVRHGQDRRVREHEGKREERANERGGFVALVRQPHGKGPSRPGDLDSDHDQVDRQDDRVPDTGSLSEDTLLVLRQMTGRFSEIPARARRGFIAEAFAEATRLEEKRAGEVMRKTMMSTLERTAARGEVPRAKLPPRVMKLPADLVRHEMMAADAPVPERGPVEIVDEIFLPSAKRAPP
jgi:Tetracyclin repressor-like, C-terminal domain